MKLVNDQCIMIVIKLTLHFIYSEEISEKNVHVTRDWSVAKYDADMWEGTRIILRL